MVIQRAAVSGSNQVAPLQAWHKDCRSFVFFFFFFRKVVGLMFSIWSDSSNMVWFIFLRAWWINNPPPPPPCSPPSSPPPHPNPTPPTPHLTMSWAPPLWSWSQSSSCSFIFNFQFFHSGVLPPSTHPRRNTPILLYFLLANGTIMEPWVWSGVCSLCFLWQTRRIVVARWISASCIREAWRCYYILKKKNFIQMIKKKSQPARREATLQEWKIAFAGLSWICCYLLESLLGCGFVKVSAAQWCLYLLLFIQHTHSHDSTLLWMLINWPVSLLSLFLNCGAFLKCFYQIYWTNLASLSLFFSLWSSSSCWTTTTIKGKRFLLFCVCLCVCHYPGLCIVQNFSRIASFFCCFLFF